MLLSRALAHWGGGTGITKTVQFNIVVKSALPTDKSFSQCTDVEIVQLAQALQNGTITTSDLNWKVGDTRNVSLSAFQTYSSSTSSTSTQAAQTAQLTIMHVGSPGIKFTDGTNVHYVIGFKNCVCNSCWGSLYNVYQNSICWEVEDNIYNALPSSIKLAFKQFVAKTAEYGNASSASNYNRYMCEPAEKEVFGSAPYSVSGEASQLTQFKYYQTAANRIKNDVSSSKTKAWWERSPVSGSNDSACGVLRDGTASGDDGLVYAGAIGMSPFGCI